MGMATAMYDMCRVKASEWRHHDVRRDDEELWRHQVHNRSFVYVQPFTVLLVALRGQAIGGNLVVNYLYTNDLSVPFLGGVHSVPMESAVPRSR